MIYVIFLLAAAAAWGQTTVNGSRTFLGGIDASATTKFVVRTGTAAPSSTDCDAANERGNLYLQTGDPASVATAVWTCTQTGSSTYAWARASHKSGTTAPATCTVGDVFFDSDATAGSNWLGCTASNTWTTMSGGAGGGAAVGFQASRENGTSTNTRLRLNCDTTPFCSVRVGGIIAYTRTTDITADISSGTGASGTLYVYYRPDTGLVYCDESAAVTVTVSGCTAATTGAVPANAIALGVSDGAFTFDAAGAFADPASLVPSGNPETASLLAGTGLVITQNLTTGQHTFSADSTQASKTDVQSGALLRCASSTLGSDAYACTTSPAFGSWTDGQVIEFEATVTANTGGATVNANSIGPIAIKKCDGSTDPADADIAIGRQIPLRYDGTVLRLPCNPATVTGGASSPLTTKGDIFTYSTTNDRLGIGLNGQVLLVDSAATTGNKWAYQTREDWIPAAISTSLAPGWGDIVGSASAGTGIGSGYTSGLPQQPYAYFNDGVAGYVAYNWRLPSNFVALVSITYHYTTGNTTGNVAWRYGAMCFTSSDSWLNGTPSFTDDAVYNSAAASTALAEASVTRTTTNLDSCGSGARVALKIGREGADGTDTHNNIVYLFGITLRYQVRVE